MAKLLIDSIEVPVSECEEEIEEVGTRGRSYNGSYVLHRQSVKRVYRITTPAMTPTEAAMVRGLVQGLGEHWSLEQNSIYTTKGYGPASGTGYAIMSDRAADGATVVNENDIDPAKYGRYALSHYSPSATPNKLPADVRDAEGSTSDFGTAGNAPTLAMDTSNYWQGTKSLKVTFPGSGAASGIYTAGGTVAGTSGEKYWGSVYVKTNTPGLSLRLYLYDADNAQTGTFTYRTLTLANVWYRLKCSMTLAADTTDLKVYLATDAPAGEIIYCDGFQLETNNSADVVHPWVDGTPAAVSLYYTSDQLLPTKLSSFTFTAWVHMPDQGLITSFRYLMIYSDLFGVLRVPSSNVGLRMFTRSETGGTVHQLNYGADSIWTGGWHHVACVQMFDPPTGRYNKEIYFDGALAAYANTTYIHDFTTSAQIAVMNNAGGACLSGSMDQIKMLPYPLTATAIAQLYATSYGAGETPILKVRGDGNLISSVGIDAIGKIDSISTIKAGTGIYKALKFTLEEI